MIYFLIGMMGSGKTTVGQELAAKLHYPFIDTDQLIEAKQNKKVHEIIHEAGINYFRSLEEDILLTQPFPQNAIVACGGGVILSALNQKRMHEIGKVIYLQSSLPTLVERLSKTNLNERPLLKGDLGNNLTQIFNEREGIYKRVSDYVVNCDQLSPDAISDYIIQTIIKELKS